MGVVNIIYLSDGEFCSIVLLQKIHLTAFCRHCGALFLLAEDEKQHTLEKWLEDRTRIASPVRAVAGFARNAGGAETPTRFPPAEALGTTGPVLPPLPQNGTCSE